MFPPGTAPLGVLLPVQMHRRNGPRALPLVLLQGALHLLGQGGESPPHAELLTLANRSAMTSLRNFQTNPTLLPPDVQEESACVSKCEVSAAVRMNQKVNHPFHQQEGLKKHESSRSS